MAKNKSAKRTSRAKPKRPACIAFVALEIYPATAGGVGILITNTIKVLLRQGYEIVLLLDVQRHEFEKFNEFHRLEIENGHNLFCYLVDDHCPKGVVPKDGFAHSEIRRSARISIALDEIKARHNIDLIEFYDYCGPAYYSLSSVGESEPALAIRLHNTVELIARKIRSPFDPERVSQFAAERTSLRAADALLSSGQQFFEEEMKALYPALDVGRVLNSPPVHMPVGQADFSQTSKNVVFYGRLSTFKGLDTFIRGAVLALDSPVFSSWLNKFLIIGPEETVASAFSLDEMKAMIPEDMKSRFHFTGRVRHDELIEHLSTAAFACFANRMESFCYAAHEIHTAGIPVIVSETAAFKDHFDDKKTAIFFDRSSRDLADKMIELSQNPALRQKLADIGLKRASAYEVDHYAGHLNALASMKRPQPAPVSCMAYVLCDRERIRINETLTSLGDVPATVLEMDDSGPIRFSGFRWRARSASGRTMNLKIESAPDAAIFLRAGDRLDGEWLKKAREVLAHRPDAGSVGGWVKRGSEQFAVSHNVLPELGLSMGPGLRTLIRMRPGSTAQEALCSWPHDGEVSMMLEHRAAGRNALELPMVNVDTTQSVSLPTQSIHNTFRVDFDRISRDFMALLTLSGQENQFARGRGSLDTKERMKLAETAANHQLAIFEVSPEFSQDEVVFLRVFKGAGQIAESWSSVEIKGRWSVLTDPNGPVQGALSARNGEMRTYVSSGGRVDLLCAPFAGAVRVYYRGEVQHVNLQRDSIFDICMRFGDELSIEPKLDQQAMKQVSTAFHDRHLDLQAEGPLEYVLLARNEDDFDSWVPTQEMRARIFPAGQFGLDGRRSGKSSFNGFAQRFGASMFMFSSRIEPTDSLAQAIDNADRGISFGLMLCGGVADSHGNAAAADRFIAAAKWVTIAKFFADRFTVYGQSPGLLGLFEHHGIKTVQVPSPVATMPDAESKPESADSVTLAAMVSHSISANMMHMVNAAIMASFRGVKVNALWLPESYQFEVRLINEIDPPFQIHWYTGLADLDGIDGDSVHIAMCCYPDEEWPVELRRVTSLGWLPLAGASSALWQEPKLEEMLTVPFWEDSLEIAKRIEGISRDYWEIREKYVAFARANEKSRIKKLAAILEA